MEYRRRAPASGLGDINRDGWVDGTDAALLGKIILGLMTPDVEMRRRADLNEDGVIDSNDLRLLHGYITGKTTLGEAIRPVTLQAEPALALKIWAAKNYGMNDTIDSETSQKVGTACLADNLATLPAGYSKLNVCNEDFLLWCMDNVGWTIPLGTVTFETTPTGADIWIDGIKQAQITPATIELEEGSYDIIFKKVGYIDCNCSRHTGGCPANVVAGQTYTISCGLIPTTVSVTATSAIPLVYCDENGCFDIPCTVNNQLGNPISIRDGRFHEDIEADFVYPHIDVPEERIIPFNFHGYIGTVTVNYGAGTINVILTAYPGVICEYVQLVEMQYLTIHHALYVYYKSQGWNIISQREYDFIPASGKKPIPDSAMTLNNAVGIYYYGQGWTSLGNTETGCSFGGLGLGGKKTKSDIKIL